MNWNPVPTNATPYDSEDQEAADEYFAMQTFAFEKRMNGTEYYNDYLEYAEKYNNQSWAKYEQYQRNFFGYDNYQEYQGYNGYNSGSSENSNGYNNYQSNNPNYVNSYSANDYYGGYNAANRKQNSAYEGQNNGYYDPNGNYNNYVNGGTNGYPYGYDGRYGYSAQDRNYSFDGLTFEQWKYSQLLEKSGREQHYFLYENGAGCKSESTYNLTFEYFHVDCGSTGKCTVGQDFLIRGRCKWTRYGSHAMLFSWNFLMTVICIKSLWGTIFVARNLTYIFLCSNSSQSTHPMISPTTPRLECTRQFASIKAVFAGISER